MAPNLKTLRDKAGLTQEQLAVRAGLSSKTLSNLEAGKGARVRTLQALADALGVPLVDLLKESA